MQMRFDGLLGFPGGLVEHGEDPLEGLNRELEEEIGLDLQKHKIFAENYLVSYKCAKKSLFLHFYAKEVSLVEFKSIEMNNLKATDYGAEVCTQCCLFISSRWSEPPCWLISGWTYA